MHHEIEFLGYLCYQVPTTPHPLLLQKKKKNLLNVVILYYLSNMAHGKEKYTACDLDQTKIQIIGTVCHGFIWLLV